MPQYNNSYNISKHIKTHQNCQNQCKTAQKNYIQFDKLAEINKLQLEAKLYNAELQDATHTEKWEKTRDRLHRAREVLEAQVVQNFFLFYFSLEIF